MRTAATERAEWWRVVCDGVIRDMQPAAAQRPEKPLTNAQVDAALDGARGPVDPRLGAEAVRGTTAYYPNRLRGPVRVLWGGQIAGAKPDGTQSWDGTAVLTAAPWVPTGWEVDLHLAPPGVDSPITLVTGQWIAEDPSDPNVLTPIRLLAVRVRT